MRFMKSKKKSLMKMKRELPVVNFQLQSKAKPLLADKNLIKNPISIVSISLESQIK